MNERERHGGDARQEELIRELEEANRELARTIDLTNKAIAIVRRAQVVIARILGEAGAAPTEKIAASDPGMAVWMDRLHDSGRK